ncbi:FtsH protease activity modulator HflK [Clostridiaceae bacterium NSJ-31]|uniref:Protein HflK n=1 Tax=Ligaoa zhengdingensis TaxID=2763658 RepID=A0A926I3X8_9FIRM|nr:FtsH protease activity modulator HflK [Ligaoa zhengdingensis]MBC8545973.1 FtsH protease activity modulator HflK [Ligaoa zhengdingensis]
MQHEKKSILSTSIKIVVLLAVAAVLLLNSMYSINEQEQAVVTTFGSPATVSTPGLHFKVPFLQQVEKVSTVINGFPIGYDIETKEPIEAESLMITSDYNFVNVDFFVEYKVSDPIKYLYSSQNPVMILKTLAQSYIRDTIGLYPVDNVITTGKNEIQAEIKEKLIDRLEKEDLGLQLVNITIQDATPPTAEVLEAFKAVETAKQSKETSINNANKYKSEQEPAAVAKVDEIIKNAEATKQSRINEAEGQVARFNAIYEEYTKNPLITKQRMFYETMEELLPSLKIVIDDGSGGVDKFLPLDSFAANEQ